MSKICIVSNNQIDAKSIKETVQQLDTDQYQRVDFDLIRPVQLSTHLNPEIDLLIYNHSHYLDINLKQQVMNWRKRGFLGSILVISKTREDGLIEQLNTLHNFVVLEKPYESKDLAGMAFKFLKTVKVNQRRYRRFSTEQNVHVESYKTEFKTDSAVTNMSMGGLRIEGHLTDLKCGDILKIQFPLDKVKREYTMNARVVWVKDSIQSEAGVEFVKDAELYSQLLDSMG